MFSKKKEKLGWIFTSQTDNIDYIFTLSQEAVEITKQYELTSTYYLKYNDWKYSIKWIYSSEKNEMKLKGFYLCVVYEPKVFFIGLPNELYSFKQQIAGQIGFQCWKDEYEFIHWIVNTKTCKIFKAKHQNVQKAIKFIDRRDDSQELQIHKILKQNQHDNILHIDEYYSQLQYDALVMKYCQQGTISDFIKQNKNLNIETAKVIMQQSLEGVSHLHELNIMHRDIKCDNIILTNDLQVKIIDFGLSNQGLNSMEKVGTIGYMAPEIFKQEQINEKSDIFSLGVVFHKLLSGQNLFENFQQNKEGNIKISEKIVDQNALDLIQQMLITDPNQRFSASDCLCHPFFTNEGDNAYSQAFKLAQITPKLIMTPSTGDQTPKQNHQQIESLQI